MTARLSIFTGKGGVGRSTAAAAFALDRARAGERVRFIAMGALADARLRFAKDAPLPPTLEIEAVDPRAIVDDFVRGLLRLGPVADVVLRHPAYESLVEIVPGLDEIALFSRVQDLREAGYDRLVLDAPATGHGVHFLEAPERTTAILVGKLKERSEEVQRALEDAKQTEIVIVTLPEETPVRETVELAAALRAHGFPLDNVVVNRWLPAVFDAPESAAVLARFGESSEARRSLERAIAQRTRIDVDEWFGAIHLVARAREENVQHLAPLRAIGAKLSLVPYLHDEDGKLAAFARAMREEATA